LKKSAGLLRLNVHGRASLFANEHPSKEDCNSSPRKKSPPCHFSTGFVSGSRLVCCDLPGCSVWLGEGRYRFCHGRIGQIRPLILRSLGGGFRRAFCHAQMYALSGIPRIGTRNRPCSTIPSNTGDWPSLPDTADLASADRTSAFHIRSTLTKAAKAPVCCRRLG
jgi:hypothetical protein